MKNIYLPATSMCCSGGQALGKSHCCPDSSNEVGMPPLGKKQQFKLRSNSPRLMLSKTYGTYDFPMWEKHLHFKIFFCRKRSTHIIAQQFFLSRSAFVSRYLFCINVFRQNKVCPIARKRPTCYHLVCAGQPKICRLYNSGNLCGFRPFAVNGRRVKIFLQNSDHFATSLRSSRARLPDSGKISAALNSPHLQ